jgi:hypothetical protein
MFYDAQEINIEIQLKKKEIMEEILRFCLKEKDFWILPEATINEEWVVLKREIDGIIFIYRIIILDELTITMQADPLALHDRWANCMFEACFNNIDSFKENFYKILENYHD